jgi:hypothetical protein
MGQFGLFWLLLAAGCLLAGLYGAVLDEISYTVSHDYFGAFKFDQFGIPEVLRGRLGASSVGWHASWRMGIYIGVPALLVALIFPGSKDYLRQALIAFAVVMATGLVVGLGGLMVATCTITEANAPWFCVPERVTDPVAFQRAGMMYNRSYLGGALGILTAWAYLIVARFRLGRWS